MMLKTLIAAAALALSPALAIAACSDHAEQVMTCADGTTYDATTKTCVVMSG
ncbi:chitin-binding domain-containing protein [Antarctobacter sp.]|uniref:chitin-binding domain-containing protein n=1 Tax=Antarctobacter sp. TaxID=1872577 RepID=UPI002B26D8B3|nr:chitin-binding domain-containing protein [Antarctobacter sp.]